jgi:exopolysaccharide production protein ExoQ
MIVQGGVGLKASFGALSQNPPQSNGFWLALMPLVVLAAIAYPSLVWPLTEVHVANAGPNLTPPPAEGPPSILVRTYFPALFGLAIIGFLVRARRMLTGWNDPALLCCWLYLAVAMWSHRWAIDPELSIRRSVLTMMIMVSVVAATLATRDLSRLVNMIFWWFGLIVIINIGALLTLPPTVLGHAGIYPHKNDFGGLVAIIVLACVHQLAAGTGFARLAAILMLPVSVWFLIAAQSKTSLALGLGVPLMAFGFAWLARFGRVSPGIAVPVVFGGVYFVYAFGVSSGFWDFEATAILIFGDPTLTQRTDIWAFALKKIPEQLWFGYGFEGFWGAGPESPGVREGPGFVARVLQAHNGYINVALLSGMVGLGIMSGMIVFALHVAGRVARLDLALGTYILSVLIFCMLYNLFETSFFRSYNVVNIMMIFVIGLSAAHSARLRRQGHRI